MKTAAIAPRVQTLASIGLLLCFLGGLLFLAQRQARLHADREAAVLEAPLLKAGALQDAIFNSVNFSSIATDAQGVIQIFNVGAERMLGYRAADVVDKLTPADISDAQELIVRADALSGEFHTTILPGFEALVYKAVRGLEDIYELTYIRADGTRVPALVSVTALHGPDGKLIGFLLIGTDNTARKQVEAEQALLDQRLRDQQFYTRSLIESNIDPLITTDPRGTISDVNHQMEMLTGRTRDELIGAPFRSCFTEPQRAEEAITRVLRESKVTNYELTALARDGKETVVSFNATTFHDRDRKLQGVFAAARDVTERKHFEHALQESNVELQAAREAAEKANRAKSEFLSSMSHELRTPLNAVLGFAQLMASEVPPPAARQQRSIDQILKGGWYLLRLINEILDLAMIESGKVTMSQEPMSMTDVLQDCKGMIEPQAAKRGIAMTFPSFDNVFYVHADRTRVKQVMINLLSNAIKYNGSGGSVIVQCVASGTDRVRVCVKDTGTRTVGGPAGAIVPAVQPPRPGRRRRRGHRHRPGRHQAARRADGRDDRRRERSRRGHGVLGGVCGRAGARCSTTSRKSHWNGGHWRRLRPGEQPTLLYVEDNPANLALVEQLIARRGDLKLLTAINAPLGIELARAYLPDVILMDINLPGMSGYGALKVLQDDPLTAHIPVLALSANAVPRDIEKGLEAGFFRYLTKPIRVREFMEALDLALHHAAEHGPRRHQWNRLVKPTRNPRNCHARSLRNTQCQHPDRRRPGSECHAARADAAQ